MSRAETVGSVFLNSMANLLCIMHGVYKEDLDEDFFPLLK